ncbi:hypothetical protein BKA62DRAFT_510746 [Auriculariales sp. MPI-PUGE-AT-0066]|nr:hypothetical protein BKA62DRAFT_510746 [Auriculariales sp. MPI-PUGE-AT-0066]
MDRLPVEIVVYILQGVAYELRSRDRQTVVNLAMASSVVYDIIAPILYERMIITYTNDTAIRQFMADGPLAKRVLRHTRFFCAPSSISAESINASLLSNVEVIYSSVQICDSIFRATEGRGVLRELRLWSLNAPADIHRLQPEALQNVTRIHSFYPYARNNDLYSVFEPVSAGWMHRLIEGFPALTHLGFSHVDPSGHRNDANKADVLSFNVVLQIAAKYSRLQVIAFRLTGRMAACLDDCVAIAKEMAEERAYFWVDDRPIDMWLAESRLMISDAQCERSLWTEARPLSSF